MKKHFFERLGKLEKEQEALVSMSNKIMGIGNGIIDRYKNPVLTAAHIPLYWRYDLNAHSNPYLMERVTINSVFNAGAIKFNDKYIVVARVEAGARKSFFAIAESDNGIDNFKFWEQPVTLPETEVPDTNVYDMRLVQHEDGWIGRASCRERVYLCV